MKSQGLKRLTLFFMAICILFIMARLAWSAEVTLEWDANTEPNLAGYNVYQAERSGDSSTAWEKIGTNEPDTEGVILTEYTLTVDGAKNWTWYVTAFSSDGIESGPSNTVELYDRTPPLNPNNLRKRKPQ